MKGVAKKEQGSVDPPISTGSMSPVHTRSPFIEGSVDPDTTVPCDNSDISPSGVSMAVIASMNSRLASYHAEVTLLRKKYEELVELVRSLKLSPTSMSHEVGDQVRAQADFDGIISPDRTRTTAVTSGGLVVYGAERDRQTTGGPVVLRNTRALSVPAMSPCLVPPSPSQPGALAGGRFAKMARLITRWGQTVMSGTKWTPDVHRISGHLSGMLSQIVKANPGMDVTKFGVSLEQLVAKGESFEVTMEDRLMEDIFESDQHKACINRLRWACEVMMQNVPLLDDAMTVIVSLFTRAKPIAECRETARATYRQLEVTRADGMLRVFMSHHKTMLNAPINTGKTRAYSADYQRAWVRSNVKTVSVAL